MRKKDIERMLPDGYGIDKLQGFWYVNGKDSYEWPETCLYVCYLDDLTIDQWIERFNGLRDQYLERKCESVDAGRCRTVTRLA